MNSPSPRAFELNLLAFLVDNKEIFREHRDSLSRYPFQWGNSRLIFDTLAYGVKTHNEIPSRVETEDSLTLAAARKSLSNIEKSQLFDDSEVVFTTKTTGLTGEKVVGYLMNQELKAITEEMATITTASELRVIRNRIDKITGLSFEKEDLGLSVFSEVGLQASVDLINSIYTEKTYATGHPTLDGKLLGGLRPKEVSCLLAPTGKGKSAWLINLAVNLVKSLRRVLYICMDNPTSEIVERTLACMSGQPIEYGNSSKAGWVDEVRAKLGGFNNLFFLKEFPPRQKTVLDLGRYVKRLRDHLYEIDRKAGLPEHLCGIIDVIIVDYLEKLKPTEKAEYRIELEINAEYLLQMGHENDCHVATASQANRQALEGGETMLHHGQESIAKFNPMGVVLGLSQTPIEKNLTLPKFRISDLKVRRPASGYSIPFLFDVQRQQIQEDPNSSTESEDNVTTHYDEEKEKAAAIAARMQVAYGTRVNLKGADSE